MKSIMTYVKNPGTVIISMNNHGLLSWMNDKANIKLIYYLRTGEKLRLDDPKSFNEKLQWLKVYDHNPRYTNLVDKIEAKRLIGEIIGNQYIVPLYGVWERAEDIDFSILPDKYVLKCNHDQGSVIVISDSNKVNNTEIISFFKSRLKKRVYTACREYAYKGIKPKVFAEEYLGEAICDYKFYCFNGEPKFLYVSQGIEREGTLKIDFFDMEWNPMPFYRTDHLRLGTMPCPTHFDEMKEIARKLSKGTKFVRIDLFEEKGKVYFSEFTLLPASGFAKFEPPETDSILGEWLNLKDK